MKKSILFLFFVIVLSSFSYAILTPNQINQWKLYVNASDLIGNDNLTEYGAVFSYSPNGADFEDSSSMYLQDSDDSEHLGYSDWSICMTINPESVTTQNILFSEFNDGGTSGIYSSIYDTAGTYNIRVAGYFGGWSATVGSESITLATENFICWVYSDTGGSEGLSVYVNDNTVDFTDSGIYNPNDKTANKFRLGAFSHTVTNEYDGLMRDVCIWNIALDSDQVNEYINYGCNGVTDLPPDINSVSQTPSQTTIGNIFSQGHINITANITDSNNNINFSKTYINLTSSSMTYINKSKIENTGIFIYTNYNNSDLFSFEIEENLILGGSYPLDFEIFENTEHLNYSMPSTSYYAKMKFYNISNNIQQSFYEIYDENATPELSITQYYYCNENYVSGNPTTSQYCTVFYEQNNNIPFNHTHNNGKSKHKVIPMGIDTSTGTINGLSVTPTSYILKRGSATGDLIYYIPNISETSQSQYSSTNGNTWNNLVGTFDGHIHQIRNTDTFKYSVCSYDTTDLLNCTGYYNYSIIFGSFPPNSVNIFSPTNITYMSGTIFINHSQSFSPSGFDIDRYTYSYVLNGSSAYNIFVSNNYPSTSYNWDVTSLTDGYYRLKVEVEDSNGGTSQSISELFYIQNPETTGTTVLNTTGLENEISELRKGINMIGLHILLIVSLLLLIFNREFLIKMINAILSFVLMLQYWTNDLRIFSIFSIVIIILEVLNMYGNEENEDL